MSSAPNAEKTPAPPQNAPGAGGRRFRYAAQSLVLGAAVTACCAFAMIITDRFPARFDVTSTREHQLSDRTRQELASLKAPYEVVVAVNGSSVDPRTARRTQDVLDSMQHASPNLKVTLLDVASAKGVADLDDALRRLVQRYGPEISQYRIALTAAVAAGSEAAAELDQLSDELLGSLSTVAETDESADALRKFLNESAAFCRMSSKEITDGSTQAAVIAKGSIGPTPVPALDEAVKTIRKPLSSLTAQLPNIGEGLAALAGSTAATVPVELRARSKQIAAGFPTLRDRLARTIASLDDLPRLPIASVARILERQSAAIIIGPPGAARGGVTAVDVSSLFPAKPAAGVVQPPADTRARTEEILISALTALSGTESAVVILVHGESIRIAPEFGPYLTQWADRLRSRGVDVLEWNAALDPDPPSTVALDPGGKRPVIYATLSTSTASRDGAARMVKLAAAVRKLAESGKRMLVSVNVSELPTTGQTDPMVEFLKPLGIDADSARPLLQQFSEPGGRVVTPDLVVTDPKANQPVAGAIRGLALRLLWPIPLRTLTDTSATVTPIVVIDNAKGTIWAESEWMAFRRVPADQRSSIANPPAPDSSRDDTKGPWTVAAAAERTITTPGAPASTQRVVVVGANGWFFDEIAQGQTVVYGHPTLFSPGNAELFDASIAWLAGQDDAIGASPQAQSLSLIPNLSEGTLAAIRWGLIAGLPLVILLVGAGWRLARG